MRKKRLGVIVNPIAGLGGPLGLGGSDGLSWLVEQGTVGPSYKRAIAVLRSLKDEVLYGSRDALEIMAGEGPFGLLPLTEASIKADKEIVCGAEARNCSRELSSKMRIEEADLIIFFGGDGTAYDVAVGAERATPVVGFPTGTKMYNPLFVLSEKHLEDILTAWLEDETELVEVEVLLIDEEKLRRGTYEILDRVKARMPYIGGKRLYQDSKDFAPTASEYDIEGIAKYLEEMFGFPRRGAWIIGPGSTLQRLLGLYGLEKGFLGLMAIVDGRVSCYPCVPDELTRILKEREDAVLLLSPLGGSGFLVGRGNKELTPGVIRALRDRRRMMVVSPREKINRLKSLLVDTGNRETDLMLEGYVRVIVGYYEESVVKVLSVVNI